MESSTDDDSDTEPKKKACLPRQCAEKKKFVYTCCGKTKKLRSLTHGGFYFGRFFILSFVTALLVAAVALDLCNVARVPVIARQAKRSARGILKLVEIVDDFLELTDAVVAAQKDMLGYDSTVRCAVKNIETATEAMALNCSEYTLRRYRRAISGFWNATQSYIATVALNELDCNASFWTKNDDYEQDAALGFWGLHKYCRTLCTVDKDVTAAHTMYKNLSFSQWIDYAVAVTGEVTAITDLYVDMETKFNDLASAAGLANRRRSCIDDATCNLHIDYVDMYGDEVQETAKDFTGAVDCLDDLYGTNSPDDDNLVDDFLDDLIPPVPPVPPPVRRRRRRLKEEEKICKPTNQFKTFGLLLRYLQVAIDSSRSLLRTLRWVSELIQGADESILVTFWVVIAALHGGTLIFLEYVVFAPNLSVSEYLAHLARSRCHTPVDRRRWLRRRRRSTYDNQSQRLLDDDDGTTEGNTAASRVTKVMTSWLRQLFVRHRGQQQRIAPQPPKSKRRRTEDDRRDVTTQAIAVSTKAAKLAKHHGTKAAKLAKHHGTKAATKGAKLAKQASLETKKNVVHHVFDRHYAWRWWILYVLHDVIFFAIMVVLLLHVIMMFLGNKRVCRYFYGINGEARSYLRRFIETAEDSCLRDLRTARTDVSLPSIRTSTVAKCDVSDNGDDVTPADYRMSLTLIIVASFGALIVQWILVHWLPTAMCFARPKKLRKRLVHLRKSPLCFFSSSTQATTPAGTMTPIPSSRAPRRPRTTTPPHRVPALRTTTTTTPMPVSTAPSASPSSRTPYGSRALSSFPKARPPPLVPRL